MITDDYFSISINVCGRCFCGLFFVCLFAAPFKSLLTMGKTTERKSQRKAKKESERKRKMLRWKNGRLLTLKYEKPQQKRNILCRSCCWCCCFSRVINIWKKKLRPPEKFTIHNLLFLWVWAVFLLARLLRREKKNKQINSLICALFSKIWIVIFWFCYFVWSRILSCSNIQWCILAFTSLHSSSVDFASSDFVRRKSELRNELNVIYVSSEIRFPHDKLVWMVWVWHEFQLETKFFYTIFKERETKSDIITAVLDTHLPFTLIYTVAQTISTLNDSFEMSAKEKGTKQSSSILYLNFGSTKTVRVTFASFVWTYTIFQ